MATCKVDFQFVETVSENTVFGSSFVPSCKMKFPSWESECLNGGGVFQGNMPTEISNLKPHLSQAALLSFT